MVAVPHLKMTVEDYFAFEAASQEKHEYYYGEIFDMTGASETHIVIEASLVSILRAQFRQRNCKVYGSNMRLQISSGHYTYPDLTAVCAPPQIERWGGVANLLNPTLIIEVLSPSTEAYDRGDKFQAYQAVESLQEYVLVSQNRPLIERYTRQSATLWTYTAVSELEATLELPSINCTLLLADVYEKVEFSSAEGNNLPLSPIQDKEA